MTAWMTLMQRRHSNQFKPNHQPMAQASEILFPFSTNHSEIMAQQGTAPHRTARDGMGWDAQLYMSSQLFTV
jgi:hypothetical protein